MPVLGLEMNGRELDPASAVETSVVCLRADAGGLRRRAPEVPQDVPEGENTRRPTAYTRFANFPLDGRHVILRSIVRSD